MIIKDGTIQVVTLMAMMAFAVIAVSANGQTSISAGIGARFVVPVTAVEKEPLRIGKIATRFGNGIVEVSPLNERIIMGSIVLVDNQFHAGKFVLSGAPNSLVSILLPPEAIKMIIQGTSREAGNIRFSSSIPPGGQPVDPDGTMDVNIGASLHIRKRTGMPSGITTVIYELIFVYN
ncbi:DUF4402 domain-containing protein [Gaoshiqia sp. Z1-71]|uniref:DUF4402 domain-containing protein n=1 Tax=Gaoshiqia hydrogeniformans TaxID=3290090 RepID=UPI003BF8BC40